MATSSMAPGSLWRAGTLLAGLAAWAPTDAAAQLSCGDTVAAGTTVTLTQDIGPCDGVQAAIIVDSATLDLGGRTVTCAEMNNDGDVPFGIVLTGRKARVMNGSVVGCYDGVYLDDPGKHRVEGVTVSASWFDGIYGESDSAKNQLIGNTVVNNLDDGFEIRGPKNKITGNVAQGNGEDGIDVVDSKATKIQGNTASNNLDEGIDVSGIGNKVIGNTTNANGGYGIAIVGRKNKIIGNTAGGNGASGDIAGASCSDNKWKNNTVSNPSSCVP